MFDRKDLLGLKDLSGEEIFYILRIAASMKEKIDKPPLRDDSLGKANVATLFYENSTRTRMSFFAAGQLLGAQMSDLGVSTSSVNKGESLIATGKNLDEMGVNVMVLRHQLTGAAHLLAENVKASVINGGDGANEHPTQALLDLYTVLDYKKAFTGLKVAIIGDVSHSRVARSNVFGLVKLGAKPVLSGPPTMLDRRMETLGAEVEPDLKKAVRDADVVMGLRIQLERQKAAAFPDLREYTRFFGVDEKILELAKPDALVMHPGPVNRGVEMSCEVIDHERSVILEQAKNGVAVRMAVLTLLLRNTGVVKEAGKWQFL